MTSHDLLLKWSRDRDELAFREIVHRHAPMVFATSRRILRNDTDAEDVTQECFETLAGARKLPGNHLAAWLHRVATNRCLDRLRAAGRRAHRETDFASREFKANATDWNDIYNLVDEAIAELPDKWRDVIVAHFLEGRSQADIANELRLTRQAVHERLGRGIDAIRAALKHRGIQIPAATLTTLFVQHLTSAEIPATLAASLGKLALSAHAIPTSGAVALVGFGVGKLLIGVAAVLLIVAAAGLWLNRDGFARGTEVPEIEAVTSTATPATNVALVQTSSSATQPSLQSQQPTPTPPAPIEMAEATADAESARTGASISGTVVRADGKPFPRAKICFYPEGDNQSDRADANADAAGNFQVDGLSAAEYSVWVMPPGVTGTGRAEVMKLTLTENEQRRDLQLQYGKGTLTITGIVTDTAGKPLKGMQISTWGQYVAYSGAVTDDQGRYTLECLPEGGYEIEAEDNSDSSIKFARGTTGARAGDKNVNIVLERMINLEGRVLRADTRAPILHFRVSFMNGHAREFRDFLMANDTTVSDTQGKFRIENASPGDVTVSALAEGFSPAFILTHGNDGVTVSGLEILLTPGHALAGMVVDAAGQPVANATLYNSQITFPSVLKNAPVVARTDAAGKFSIAAAPPARSFLAAYHEDYAPAAVRIGTGDVKIVMQRPASLKVTATAPENMLTDAYVTIFFGLHAHTDYADGVRFDKDGVAVKAGLVPGPITLRINRQKDSDKSYVERNVVLQAGTETEVHVDFAPITASLNGTVTWRETPTNAIVTLQIQTSTGTELYKCTTERDSSYSFTDLPAGNATVRVDMFETLQSSSTPNVAGKIYLEKDKLTTYNINLVGASTISGHVGGITLPDASWVMIFQGSYTLEELSGDASIPFGLLTFVRGAACDAEGNYSVSDLEPGEYTVSASIIPQGEWSMQQRFAVEHITVTANQPAVADFTYR